MADREQILKRLPDPKGGERPTPAVRVRAVPAEDLWERFGEKLHALGGKVMALESLGQFRTTPSSTKTHAGGVREVLGNPAPTSGRRGWRDLSGLGRRRDGRVI